MTTSLIAFLKAGGKNPRNRFGVDYGKYISKAYDNAVCIPTTMGYHFLIDAEDFNRVSNRPWQAKKSKYTTYAWSGSGDNKVRGVHRLVMDAATGEVIDHINGDGLDCRKSNLRKVGHYENKLNSQPRGEYSSSYKGVYWQKQKKRWAAEITSNYKKKYLGLFASEIEAALNYDAAASKIHGEYAWLNFRCECNILTTRYKQLWEDVPVDVERRK